jgi:hypothetical protein
MKTRRWLKAETCRYLKLFTPILRIVGRAILPAAGFQPALAA